MLSIKEKIHDWKQNFDLIQFASQFEYIKSGSGIKIRCPFHTESTASCQINQGYFYCFGCGAKGDSLAFVQKITGKNIPDILGNPEYVHEIKIEVLEKQNKPAKKISRALIKNMNNRLLNNTSKMKYLFNRGFDKKSIEQSLIGYGYPLDLYGYKFNHERYSIPHFMDGKLVGVRYRIDPKYEKIEDAKYVAQPGVPGILYNVDILKKSDTILYVGSQFDAAFSWYRFGIAAISPPGENTFKKEWIPEFCNKRVLIWLDNDEAGFRSSLKVYDMIKHVCDANIYQWSSSWKIKDDYTDVYKKYGIDYIYSVLNDYKFKISERI